MVSRVPWVLGLCLLACIALAGGGCPALDLGGSGVGLTGFVGLEMAAETVGGAPAVAPVAVVLAESGEAFPDAQPLSGVRVELFAGSTRLARTSTDARGLWALPRRPERALDIRITGPVGLFGTVAPPPIVKRERVSLGGAASRPWPGSPRRIPRAEIVEDAVIIVEEAGQ